MPALSVSAAFQNPQRGKSKRKSLHSSGKKNSRGEGPEHEKRLDIAPRGDILGASKLQAEADRERPSKNPEDSNPVGSR